MKESKEAPLFVNKKRKPAAKQNNFGCGVMGVVQAAPHGPNDQKFLGLLPAQGFFQKRTAFPYTKLFS
jgi:hypothetical protein